jgi:hypothetical protein
MLPDLLHQLAILNGASSGGMPLFASVGHTHRQRVFAVQDPLTVRQYAESHSAQKFDWGPLVAVNGGTRRWFVATTG